MQGTFTVAGQKVRTSSTRRFVAWRVWKNEDGTVASREIFKRSDRIATIRTHVQRQGFRTGRHFVIIDTSTGEDVTRELAPQMNPIDRSFARHGITR